MLLRVTKLKKVKNAKNEGSQVEFEQFVQMVSLALQTHFWLEYFYSVLCLLIQRIYRLVGLPTLCPNANGESNPLGTSSAIPCLIRLSHLKQAAVIFNFILNAALSSVI